MSRGTSRALCAAAAVLAAAGAARATDPMDCAVGVASFAPGPAGELLADEALGPPQGAGNQQGSFDTATLGISGELVLELGNAAVDGPGADLLVCENPFLVGLTGSVFAETCFVEASSDGVHFARFPVRYSGPPGPFAPFAGVGLGWYAGLAGVHPVRAGTDSGIDALDIVAGGGDAFDLADLAGHALVQSGDLDLGGVRWVRLVDIDSGNAFDDHGATIWDAGIDTQSSADIDAVVALNSDANQSGGRPRVELALDEAGFLSLSVLDLDGFADVKQGLSASLDGAEIPFGALLPFFVLTGFDAYGFTLVTGPVPPGAFPLELRVGARDKSGLFGGDALALP